MGTLHKNLTADDIHTSVARDYADITARDADTAFHANAENVNKIIRVDSPISYYILENTVPTWHEFTVTGQDSFLELSDTPSSYVGAELQVARVNAGGTALEFSTAGMGDVAGPVSATDNALPRFDGITGKILKDSPITVDDAGLVTGIREIFMDGNPARLEIQAVNNANIEIEVDDLTPGTFNTRSQIFMIPTNLLLHFDEGDGAGALTARQTLSLSSFGMDVIDGINLKGFEYGADYSANFTDRSLIDKAYADTKVAGPASATDNELPRYDGTTGKLVQVSGIFIDDAKAMSGLARIDVPDTAIFQIEGNNAADILIRMHDLTSADFLERTRFIMTDDTVDLLYETGNGSGNIVSSSGLVFNSTIMQIIDGHNARGLQYAGDYSTNFIDRSLVDKEYVDVGAGKVSGPVSSTDNEIARFDGATGKLVQGSGVFISDNDQLSGLLKIKIDDGASFELSGNVGVDIAIQARDFTPTNFQNQGRLFINSGAADLIYETGDGAGNVNTSQGLNITRPIMKVIDGFNQRGLEYAADYSANFTPRTLVDRAYVDAGDTKPAGVIFARVKADLPAPIGGVITIPDGDVIVLEAHIDLGSDRIEMGVEGGFTGFASSRSSITSSTSGATVTMGGGSGSFYGAEHVGFFNTGSGVALTLSNGSSLIFVEFSAIGGTNVADFFIFEGSEAFFVGPVTFILSSTTGLFNMQNVTFFVGAGEPGLKFNPGVTVGVIRLDSVEFDLADADSHGIVVTNPGQVPNGRLTDVTTTGAGTELLSVSPGLGTAVGVGLDPTGVAVFEGNLYVSDAAGNAIIKYVGISNTVDTSIASPNGVPKGITFVQGNLISCQGSPGLINVHLGFSTTIQFTIALPLNVIPDDVTFDGVNLIVIQQGFPGKIFIMDGVSDTVLRTFTAGFQFGIHYDGANLWVASPSRIDIHRGTSTTVQYQIEVTDITGGASGGLRGMAQTEPGGPVIFGDILDAGEVFFTDNPIVLDQSSPTWQMHQASPVLDSADAGCSCVRLPSGAPVTISTVDTWIDLADSGEAIIYTFVGANEKFILSDSDTGELTYIGVLKKAFTVSGVLLSETAAGTDTIEIGVSINGLDPSLGAPCSMVTGIVTTTQAATLTAPASSIRLVQGDTIRLQVRNRTDSSNLNVFQSLLSVKG